MNWFQKLSSLMTNTRSKLRREITLSTSAEGFTAECGGEKKFVPWSDIKRMTVFKRDLMTVDMICMLISAGDKIIELNETMIGWSEFSSSIENHLPGCTPWAEWSLKVMFPAFETNATDIFNKQGSKESPEV